MINLFHARSAHLCGTATVIIRAVRAIISFSIYNDKTGAAYRCVTSGIVHRSLIPIPRSHQNSSNSHQTVAAHGRHTYAPAQKKKDERLLIKMHAREEME